MDEVWHFHHINLFDGLKREEIDKILKIVIVKGFKPGEIIFRPGDPVQRIFVLRLGMVKTYVFSGSGQEKIMHIFSPGDAFGGSLLGTRHGELPWAQAVDTVVLCYMDRQAFLRFMQEFPKLALNIFDYMTEHHAADMRRMESLIHTRAIHRLLLTILELGNQLGFSGTEEFDLGLRFTHEDLANMIGVTRSTASTIIGELRDAGVLSKEARSLSVNRRMALEYLLEDDELVDDLLEGKYG